MEIADPRKMEAVHPRRVVIAGGGYAGMTLAATLAHRMRDSDGLEIVLLNPRPYQQALSELDLVAAGTPRPQFAELWHGDVFAGLPIACVYDRLEGVDPADGSLTVGPDGQANARLPYWRLVIATGAVPLLPPIPGLAEHAITMWSVPDAHRLQRSIEHQFGLAATLAEPEARAAAISMCVVGAGATGVEVVGTMADVLPPMMRRVGFDPTEVRMTLLDARPDILYDLPESSRARARRRLEDMGVSLVLGEKVARVDERILTTETGREIGASVLVWCGGAHADPDAVRWGLEADTSGRLVVDDHLRATGHEDIYAIGDVAAFRDPDSGRVLPMLAQFAIREAEQAADNILSEARGQATRPFRPHMHGEFVSIGPRYGVGWMFRLSVSGRFAIVMKRLTYVLYWLQVGSYRIAWRRTRQMLSLRR